MTRNNLLPSCQSLLFYNNVPVSNIKCNPTGSMHKRSRLLQLFLENCFRISPFRIVQLATTDLLSSTHFLGIQLQKFLHWVLGAMTTALQTTQANSFSVKLNFVQTISWLGIFLFVHHVLLKRSLKSTGTDRARSAFPLTCTTASLHPNLPQFPSPQPSH